MFVAVDPPEVAVADLGAVVDTLAVSRANEPGRSTRLAARDRWHITLAFLGDVSVTATDRVVAALTSGADDGDPPGPVAFAGGGTFGRGNFTILWAGMGGDVPGLRRLAGSVRSELRRRHVWFDGKGFRPHLTISRPGSRLTREQVADDVAVLEAYEGPLWSVDAVHLVASELGPKPIYTRLASIPLAG
jgi:2'-5' RNA ligase